MVTNDLPKLLLELATDLADGRIDCDGAQKRYRALTTNLYTRAWWKHHRDGLIKNYCEQCHGVQGPFVLQHLDHPESFSAKRKRYPSMDERQALIDAIREMNSYLTTYETFTFCTKCAYLWDKKKMQLCTICHRGYHKQKWSCCFECHKADREPEPGEYDLFGWVVDDEGNPLGPNAVGPIESCMTGAAERDEV